MIEKTQDGANVMKAKTWTPSLDALDAQQISDAIGCDWIQLDAIRCETCPCANGLDAFRHEWLKQEWIQCEQIQKKCGQLACRVFPVIKVSGSYQVGGRGLLSQ